MKKFNLNPQNTAFLIIDLQERLMGAMKYKEQVYDNTKLMLATCKELDIPVIVTEQYPKGLGRTVAEVSESLGEHTLLEKIQFSAVTEESLEKIEGLDRKQIIVVGSETHVCVFQTVRDLVAVGYQVYVLQDGVCSRRKHNFKNGLAMMKEAGAIITDTETAVFDLFKIAGTPEFKKIQGLIK